jgi:hypothetical protein
MKFKHNKKRNVAFIYEALIRELAVATLNEKQDKKKKIQEAVKTLFSKNSVLGKELRLYKTLLETRNVDYITAEKILYEVRRVYSSFNQKAVYDAQTAAIHHINHEITPKVFAKFVPNYKSLATIYNFFNGDELNIKNKVLLERQIIETMVREKKKLKEEKKPINRLIVQTFAKKFNETYGGLLEEQKSLLAKFVSSSFEEDTELKVFVNEELERIRAIVVASFETKEIKSDTIMLENSKKVLDMIDSFKHKKKIDQEGLILVLKMQQLVKEIKS